MLLLVVYRQDCSAAQLGIGADHASSAAIDVLADLMLIDGGCQCDRVNFGIAFSFASERGVPETAVLPGGSRRAEFITALRARRASFTQDQLCGEIAANYAEALPGSVIIPQVGE